MVTRQPKLGLDVLARTFALMELEDDGWVPTLHEVADRLDRSISSVQVRTRRCVEIGLVEERVTPGGMRSYRAARSVLMMVREGH